MRGERTVPDSYQWSCPVLNMVDIVSELGYSLLLEFTEVSSYWLRLTRLACAFRQTRMKICSQREKEWQRLIKQRKLPNALTSSLCWMTTPGLVHVISVGAVGLTSNWV